MAAWKWIILDLKSLRVQGERENVKRVLLSSSGATGALAPLAQ